MGDVLEAINYLINGINPLTGEMFDKSIMSENCQISSAITQLALCTQPHLKIDKNLWRQRNGNPNSELIFNALKEWRLEQSRILGIPAYLVFSDADLSNISEAIVTRKEDLLLIKGVAKASYLAYGDELYAIHKEFA